MVFVFPDLTTGNTTYKAVQRSAHVVSIGPILHGLRKPVSDASRGTSPDDPFVARWLRCFDQIACVHMPALLVRSYSNAGRDGFRDGFM
jgi:phosphotransacetylase